MGFPTKRRQTTSRTVRQGREAPVVNRQPYVYDVQHVTAVHTVERFEDDKMDRAPQALAVHRKAVPDADGCRSPVPARTPGNSDIMEPYRDPVLNAASQRAHSGGGSVYVRAHNNAKRGTCSTSTKANQVHDEFVPHSSGIDKAL